MQKKLFITFEGCEGTGKSTQAKLLKDFLEKHGRQVFLTREPGGTELGKRFRQIILDPENRMLETRAELFLYFADRAQHVSEIISPALAKGMTVISDRYFDATFAYQGGGRGLDLETLRSINRFACAGLIPDITILLDIDAETGLKRAKRTAKDFAAGAGDRMEQQSIEFHERVRNAYLNLAKEESSRFIVIDATGSVDEVHAKISAALLAQKVLTS